jgi:dipeptide/tripeptide permease
VLACVVGAAGFVLLAAAHDSALPIYVANGVLGIGVGFAFASLANLVVSAVDPRQTGEATGINTIMRTIGGTFGAQLAATIVTSTPGEGGYTTAFTLSAVAMAVAAVVASASRGRQPVGVSG